MGYGVHVGGIVLEGGARLEWRGEVGSQVLPIGAVLIHHPDVVVVVGSRVPVEHVCLIRGAEREPGWVAKDSSDVLRVGQGQ